MVMTNQIKEFAEEIEPKERRCLFCEDTVPDHLNKDDMEWRRGGWYSNALLDTKTRQIVRFYLCPLHRSRRKEAWGWARGGFIEDKIAELKGMAAVLAWLEYHPKCKNCKYRKDER